MSKKRFVVGIDLSGPRNTAETALAAFEHQDGRLCLLRGFEEADDRRLLEFISDIGRTGSIVVGLDAPLSYNTGGGDRPSDAALRRRVKEEKGHVGIMPPTLIRMVYLTLRGIALTRALETFRPQTDLQMVEVHPGAAMLLRGAPADDVAAFKGIVAARIRLLDWLETAGLGGLPRGEPPSDHQVAAYGAALAAWKWSEDQAAWRFPARPPEHPYDFAC